MKQSNDSDKTLVKELRLRAAAFSERAIPPELRPNYVAGSLADIVIASYARTEPIDSDLLEIAEMAAHEYDGAIERAKTRELKDYYTECQAILRAIIAEAIE
jgi:hypothetical protein